MNGFFDAVSVRYNAFVKINKLKRDIRTIKSGVAAKTLELGNKVYSDYIAKVSDADGNAALCDIINDKRKTIDELNAEIKRTNEEKENALDAIAAEREAEKEARRAIRETELAQAAAYSSMYGSELKEKSSAFISSLPSAFEKTTESIKTTVSSTVTKVKDYKDDVAEKIAAKREESENDGKDTIIEKLNDALFDVCPSCGAKQRAGTKFCRECGAKVNE